jgi:hypothetical protein
MMLFAMKLSPFWIMCTSEVVLYGVCSFRKHTCSYYGDLFILRTLFGRLVFLVFFIAILQAMFESDLHIENRLWHGI